MQPQPKSRQRFPELISVGVTQEIADGLQRSTGSGLLTISDMVRIYLYRGLVADGHVAPTYQSHQQEMPQHVNGNGGAYVPSR